MEKKGFPESYDGARAAALPLRRSRPASTMSRRRSIRTSIYDVVPGETVSVDRPDILIVEGLNVLQPSRLPRDGKAMPFVSDFFDFSIYLDADEDLLENWYIARFMRLRETAFRDPALLLPEIRRSQRRRGRGDRPGHLEPHQPAEPAREHPADPAARQTSS